MFLKKPKKQGSQTRAALILSSWQCETQASDSGAWLTLEVRGFLVGLPQRKLHPCCCPRRNLPARDLGARCGWEEKSTYTVLHLQL